MHQINILTIFVKITTTYKLFCSKTFLKHLIYIAKSLKFNTMFLIASFDKIQNVFFMVI